MNLFTPAQSAPGSAPMILRDYQFDAVKAAWDHIRHRDDNPVIVMPTGAGKTPVIATLCRDAVGWQGRVLVLAHVKELIEQSVAKLNQIAPELHVGIYSAGIGRKDTRQAVIVAGVQSAWQRATDLGHIDIVIVDEAHMIPTGDSGDGMYRRLLADLRKINPLLRVIGLTATAFRLGSGPICLPAPDGILNAVCYEVGVRELIARGFLSHLRSKAGLHKPDTNELSVKGGEFVAAEAEAAFDGDDLVRGACTEIVGKTKDRRSVLVFCQGVKHGQHVAQTLASLVGDKLVEFVDGTTPTLYRDQVTEAFRRHDIKYLVNVNVFTTGFDAPGVDCVALLRATMSPGLYYQMVGRGFRIAEGKTDCLVLDYGGNVMRHGPVDAIRVKEPGKKGDGVAPVKTCPICQELVPAGAAVCTGCGHEFPARQEAKHEGKANEGGVLSGEVTNERLEVRGIEYRPHTKKDAPPDAPRTLRVIYEVGWNTFESEWICIEHQPGSFAHRRAVLWWRERSNAPIPMSVDDALHMIDAGALADTIAVTLQRTAGEKFPKFIRYELGDKPHWDSFAAPAPDPDASYSDDPGSEATTPAPGTPGGRELTDEEIPF